jgi:hypothetical protein
MDTEEEKPYFLELEKYHLSERKARETVIELLQIIGIKSPKGGWDQSTITNGPPEKEEKYSFRELVQMARYEGVVYPIQRNLDHSDEIFGGTFGISTSTMALGQVTTSYAGHSRVLKPPLTDMPVEYLLSDDIIFYREETCLWSNEYNFEMCTRNYRSYLFACIAIVDAFINRHILIYQYRKYKIKEVEELLHTSRLEDRLNLFLILSTGQDISAINKGTEWLHFKALRKLRNEMTHINSPSLGYSIGEFEEHLNYSKLGIGGLLKLIRVLQRKNSLSFIERIRTAPLVFFNDITFKADDKYIIKRRKK